MKPLSPETNKGRTVSVDDVHHKTADQSKVWQNASAKKMKHAARQKSKADIKNDISVGLRD